MTLKNRHPQQSEGPGVCRGSSHRAAFTMPELLVVMGIILIFIALAVPAFNALSGTRSIAAAENNLASALVRAREEAIGLQEIRGILFSLDPKTDRVMVTIVHQTDAPTTGGPYPPATVWLDVVPDREQLLIAPGVRLQTAFDGLYSQINDRYLGYNDAPIGDNHAKFGGVILFDSNGRLVTRNYGFRLVHYDTSANPPFALPTGIADMMFFQGDTNGKEQADAKANDPYVPFVTDKNAPSQYPWYPVSQAGIALFDRKDFDTAGFVDADNQSNETAKEKWIDDNATPILINRYTGGMIRGE